MQWNRLIQTIKDSNVPLDRRLAILDVLYDTQKPDALIGVCQSCLTRQPDVVEKSQRLLKKLDYEHFSDVINFALDDESNSFSGMQILDILYKLRARDVLKYVMESLYSSDNSERKRKTIAVWLRGSQLMDRCISGILRLPKEVVHTIAVALKNLDGGITIDVAKIAKEAQVELCLKALDLLQEMEAGSEVIPSLMGLLASKDAKVRAKVTFIICKVSSNIQLFEHSLRDKDESVRARAIEAMWGVNHPQIRDSLLPCLYDPGEMVRANAAKALYLLRDKWGLSRLMEMLTSSDPGTRSTAALALGELNEASASERLTEMAEKDESEMVRNSASKALERMNKELGELANQLYSIGGVINELEAEECQEIAPFTSITNALNDINGDVLMDMTKGAGISDETCLQMVHILRSVPKEMALPVLIKSLHNEDNEMDPDAILSLQEIAKNLKSIESGLRHSKPIVRKKTIQTLCDMQEPAVESLLLPNLENDNTSIVANTAKVLCDIENKEGMGALVKMMRSPDESMRANAMWALGKIGVENVKKQLEVLSEDDEGLEVQEREMDALVKIADIASKEVIEPAIKYVDVSEFPTVRLCLCVYDGEGQPVDGLANDNFSIMEGGEISRDTPVESSKGDMPIAIAIAIDYSLSMDESDIENIDKASLNLVKQMREMDSGAIIKFSIQASVVQSCTADKELLIDSIKAASEQEDGTALYDAIHESTSQISGAEGIKAVIVITDGEDTNSTHSPGSVIAHALKNKTSVYAIGLGDSLEGSELRKIAEETKGQYYSLADSKSLDEKYNFIQQALRNHYSVGYTSKSEPRESIRICVSRDYIRGNDFVRLPILLNIED